MCKIMEEYAEEIVEEMILNALRKGKDPLNIADYFDVPIEQVLNIKEEIESK